MADSNDHEPVLLRIPTAAALIDTTPGALRKMLERASIPAGVVIRKGRRIWIHRSRFLDWFENNPSQE